jgi:hypothetical protein
MYLHYCHIEYIMNRCPWLWPLRVPEHVRIQYSINKCSYILIVLTSNTESNVKVSHLIWKFCVGILFSFILETKNKTNQLNERILYSTNCINFEWNDNQPSHKLQRQIYTYHMTVITINQKIDTKNALKHTTLHINHVQNGTFCLHFF